MASNTALNNETICDLKGQPLDRSSVALLKAIDQLLTVGSYYSADHDQYHAVSEKSCAQIVEAIRPGKVLAIEITASGMMIQSQLVDPNHRNVRFLHDLLVPLNIAQLEIDAGLTPADLRQAISALQEHKQSLGSTTGFREIKIENLPPTVNTASRGVVRGNGDESDSGIGDGAGGGVGNGNGNRVGGGLGEGKISLDELLGSGPFGDDQASGDNNSSGDEPVSESEKLAREFMEIVSRILENLEQNEPGPGEEGSTPHPDTTPENIKSLREALRRLVEVNPDPADLARLIDHAKRAMDLSRDPRSVDLVFSLLKSAVERGSGWKYKAEKEKNKKPKKEFRLSLEQLRGAVSELEAEGRAPAEPQSSSLGNYLGICFHLLADNPSGALETVLTSSLEQAISDKEITPETLKVCSVAVETSALKDNQLSLDRVLPAFCNPLRTTRPENLVEFWTGLWESLDPEPRALVWPHLVSDLLLGLGDTPGEATERLWLAAGGLDSKAAVMQTSRLECTPALRNQTMRPGLMKLPLKSMFPIHLALMKSTLAPVHGPRIHHHLHRHPPNDLTEILMKVLAQYDPSYDSFYLSLIKQNNTHALTPDLRRMATRLICESLVGLPDARRNDDWVPRAIGWLGKLDPGFALPLLTGIRDKRRFFFFKAWPGECRGLAAKIISDFRPDGHAKDGG